MHTGTAFVGALGSDHGTTDITVLGDTANIAARLSSQAGVGEVLISDSAFKAADVQLGDVEKRTISLKGRNEPLLVWVLPGKEK